jgi:hypothetical protein
MLTKVGIFSPGQYTSLNAKREHVDDLISLAIQGTKESVQWRDEVDKDCVYTETFQMFMPAEPTRDAQLLITISMDEAWNVTDREATASGLAAGHPEDACSSLT